MTPEQLRALSSTDLVAEALEAAFSSGIHCDDQLVMPSGKTGKEEARERMEAILQELVNRGLIEPEE